MTTESAWIDVTVPVHGGLPTWPGDPPLALERASDLERGDDATVTRLALGAHAGTHVDAPLHFLRGGAPVDAMPPAAMMGPARVLAFPGVPSIDRAALERAGIQEGERILLRTSNSDAAWFRAPFRRDYVHLREDAAAFLAERRIRTLGIDYLSVGPFADAAENAAAHRRLLGAGVWIVEGLWLGDVAPGACDLVCLPLRLEGAEGAPARVLVRPHVTP